MADVTAFNVGGTAYSMQDATARNNAASAVSSAEYNRQSLIGKYAGQNLATLLAGEIASGKTVFDALHTRVSKANFAGLRVGDYMDVTLLDTYGSVCTSQTIRFVLAHFDPYYQCGDTAKGHHIAFVAQSPIAVASTVEGVANTSYLMWNTTATNQGTADEKHPYLCSNLKAWEDTFEAVLPSTLTQYLLEQRILLEERYSASGDLTDSNGWSWADIGKVWSLSEMELYGCSVWGTPGYSVGFDCQFDLFKDTAHRINGSRVTRWLRSVPSGSASNVCYCTNTGGACHTAATDGWVRPWVGFLLG